MPDIFVKDCGLDAIGTMVNVFKGLKVVSYYGCLLVRPPARI